MVPFRNWKTQEKQILNNNSSSSSSWRRRRQQSKNKMSNSRIIKSLLQSSRSRWPSLGFGASSFSTPRLSLLPLSTALNPSFSSSRFELELISNCTYSFTHRLLSSTASTHNKQENQKEEEDPHLCISLLFCFFSTTPSVWSKFSV